MAFETIDIVLVVILGLGFFVGYKRGFISQLGTICAVVIAIWVSYNFSDQFLRVVEEYVDLPEKYKRALAFVLLFLSTAIPTRLLANLLLKSIRYMGLGGVDRFMGGVFGFIKWLILSSLFLTLFQEIDKEGVLLKHQLREDALLYVPVQKSAQLCFPFIKSWLEDITFIPKT
ncbi:MAG: CvpA family protein [Bacteroidales bacterium]